MCLSVSVRLVRLSVTGHLDSELTPRVRLSVCAGWSSLSPEQTFEQYSVPCRELRQGDICLTSGGPLQSPRPPLSAAHTPPGSPAARVVPPPPPPPPSTAGRPQPPPPSPASTAAAAAADKPVKPKRPMNGFMLFAKKYRVELINQHPGKDNR